MTVPKLNKIDSYRTTQHLMSSTHDTGEMNNTLSFFENTILYKMTVKNLNSLDFYFFHFKSKY